MKRKLQIDVLTVAHCTTASVQSESHSRPSRRTGRRHKKKSASTYGFRKWVYAKRDRSSFKGCTETDTGTGTGTKRVRGNVNLQKIQDTDRFVLLSYNILGVENASKHPDLYFNIPPKYLDWDHRKKLICKEINHYHPDIICFQEVDRFEDLDDALQKYGFKGALKTRTGDACDGCAIFWKKERFTLLHEDHIEFQGFGLRHNVAQFCILQMNSSRTLSRGETPLSDVVGRSLVVGNIHMLFNPNRGDIKLGQIRLFIEKAYELAEERGGIPVVLAGDLNSVPQSAIYRFMSSNMLDVLQHERRTISGQIDASFKRTTYHHQQESSARSRSLMYRWTAEELKLATGEEQQTFLQHPLRLKSVYSEVKGNSRTRDDNGEPLVTSCHSKFMGTVDYIWHTEELVPLRVVETLPVDVLEKMGGLPNKNWGSDHLSLVCQFAFADSGISTVNGDGH